MAAGYDLKEGKYDQSPKTVKEIKNVFSKFFEKSSKRNPRINMKSKGDIRLYEYSI